MNFLELFGKFDIGEPPWEYDFLLNLEESEYPKYLAKIFNYKTGEKLPLRFDFKTRNWIIDKKRCKTFNQKIQWLKLYDATPLKKMCTDKVLVRDYVAEKIGEEYLKPVLQICDNVEEIDWDNLPNQIVIKASNGCKWQYLIKDKESLLKNAKPLLEQGKRNMSGWLEQDYSFWGGFEMQYKGLYSKVLIEPYLTLSRFIEVYCFNGKPKIYVNIIKNMHKRKITFYNEDYSISDLKISLDYNNQIISEPADDLLKKSVEMSKKLANEFNFVRIDWIVLENKLYFEELTFTPNSGFSDFTKNWNKKVGYWINI